MYADKVFRVSLDMGDSEGYVAIDELRRFLLTVYVRENLSFRQMADKLSVSLSTLWRFVMGVTDIPRDDFLIAVVSRLYWLWGDLLVEHMAERRIEVVVWQYRMDFATEDA